MNAILLKQQFIKDIKEIIIKGLTYYFFDDIINIKNFDSNLLKIDKKSCKNNDIFYVMYVTMKHFDYVKINSVNPLYIIISKTDGSIEEKSGNKHLTFASTDKNKEVLKKYTKLWDKTKKLTDKVDDKPGEYEKDYMKIKFNSDDDLPLNRILKLHNLTIVVSSVFQENGKYYPQVFLDECLYELQMLEYDRIDISEGIDINKTNTSKESDICHYMYFLDKGFKYEHSLCNGCHI